MTNFVHNELRISADNHYKSLKYTKNRGFRSKNGPNNLSHM